MTDYRKASAEDVPDLKKLWLKCFSEREEAAELFFKRNSASYHGYCACNGTELVSALYLIDCTLCGKQAHYLCGAATLPKYRGKGVMSELIRFALADGEARGDCYSALLPATEKLYGYYAARGYEPCGVSCTAKFDCEVPGCFSVHEPDIEKLQIDCFTDKFLLWNKNYMDFASEYYACYGIDTAKSGGVFALYEQKDDYADVIYAAFNDIKELKMVLYDKGIRHFRLTGSPDQPIMKNRKTEKSGMLRALNGSAMPEDFYIGITLD